MSSAEQDWFKSSDSGSTGDNCIEVALLPGFVLSGTERLRKAAPGCLHDACSAFTTLTADSSV